MLQKRRLQAVWETDNRSQSSTPPTLTYTCKRLSDGITPCTGVGVALGTQANVYDNDGYTVW